MKRKDYDWHTQFRGAEEARALARRLWRPDVTGIDRDRNDLAGARYFQLALNHLLNCGHPVGTASFEAWLPMLRRCVDRMEFVTLAKRLWPEAAGVTFERGGLRAFFNEKTGLEVPEGTWIDEGLDIWLPAMRAKAEE